MCMELSAVLLQNTAVLNKLQSCVNFPVVTESDVTRHNI